MKIILATRNPSKAEQIKAIFGDVHFEILTLEEAGIEGEVIEDGDTLEENAFKKARFARDHLDGEVWVMADDTGLFIDALDGEPGVHAAYWGGENKSTEERMQYALDKLNGVEDRSAEFKTIVAVISPEAQEYVFEGVCEGSLLDSPRVAPQPKMLYSSLFVPNGFDKAWAEMDVEEENTISHRGDAFRKVKEFLENRIKQ